MPRFYLVSCLGVTILNLCVFAVPDVVEVDKSTFQWLVLSIVTLAYFFITTQLFSKTGYIIVVLDVSFLALYALPSVGLILQADQEFNIGFCSLFLFIPLLMGNLEQWTSVQSPNETAQQPLSPYWTLLVLVAGYGFLIIGERVDYIGVGFLAFIGFALLILNKACHCFAKRHTDKTKVYQHFGLIMVGLVGWLLFFWGGFGRLYAVTLFLFPILVMVHHGFIKYRRLWLILLSPVALLLGMLHRQGSIVLEAKTLGSESSAHHLIVQSELYHDAYRYIPDLYGLLEQLSLLYLNWFPRFWWNDKPLGFGLTIVDRVYARSGFSSGFSVSPGFYGAHLFYNPEYWYASAFSELLLFYLSILVVRKYSQKNEAVMIMYLANIPSLLWGGGATFGTRVWWSVIPCIIILEITHAYKRMHPVTTQLNKHQFVKNR